MKRNHVFLLTLLMATLLTGCKNAAHVSNLRLANAARIEVTAALPEDAAAIEFLSSYKTHVDSIRKPLAGHSAMFMSTARPESLLGNWTADVFLQKANAMGYAADLAIYNVGGIRSTMPEGEILRGTLMDIFPFKNYLTIVTLNGDDLILLFQQVVSTGGECVSHGVRLTMNAERKLLSATLNGENIRPENSYKIATINYLADGNDKLTAFSKNTERINTDMLAFDVVYSYVTEMEQQHRQLSSALEGRITIKEGSINSPN